MKTNEILSIISLQLFADAYVNTTTSEGLTAEMKTYYDMTLIDEAGPNLIHNQFGQKRPIPKGKGKTIEFRKFNPLPKATTPLVEGVTPTGSKPEVSTITATVAQYGDYIAHSDMLELTAIDDVILEDTKLLGQQGGVTVDTITRNVMQSGTNVTYCPKIAEDGTKTEVTSRANLDKTSVLTVDVIKQAVAKLKAQNAPKIDGSYIGIIHPYVAYDLMNDKAWIDPNTYADATKVFEGEIGKIAGVRFMETSEAKIYSGEGCPEGLAVFGTLVLGANAYGITEIEGGGMETIIKQKGSAGSSDPLDQRSTVGWKATHTAELLVSNYICRVESCSPAFSATTEAN